MIGSPNLIIMKNTYTKLSLDKINNNDKNTLVKNYIISNTRKAPKYVGLNESFLFDGIILGVCLQGHGRMKINHREFDLGPNKIVCILPDNICKMIKISDNFLFELMFFSQDYISSFSLPVEKDILLNVSENPVLEVNDFEMQDILEIHSIIIKQDHENLAYKERILKSLMTVLILQIGSYYKIETEKGIPKEYSREEEMAQKFFSLLISNFRQEKNLSFYADKLCLTPNYLSSVIKKVTGGSIQEWIKNIVIMEAKNKLKTTDFTILQISEDLNFANPSFFGRYFKQYVGMTPLQYRNS